MAKIELSFDKNEWLIVKDLKKQLKRKSTKYVDVKEAVDTLCAEINQNKENIARLKQSLLYDENDKLLNKENLVTKSLIKKAVNDMSLKIKVYSILVEHMTKICKDEAIKDEEN